MARQRAADDILGDFRDLDQPVDVEAGLDDLTHDIDRREDIVQGIENAPEAFMGLLKGRNFGKLLVQVAEDPTRK